MMQNSRSLLLPARTIVLDGATGDEKHRFWLSAVRCFIGSLASGQNDAFKLTFAMSHSSGYSWRNTKRNCRILNLKVTGKNMAQLFSDITKTIGRTPLVRLNKITHGLGRKSQ